MSKQNKVIFFSHENDIDGLGCVVLGKLAFGNIEYVLASNVYILEEKFREYLEKKLLYQYDRIFVTDLALRNPSLEIVSKNPELSKKVLVFDHHISSINEGLNKYSFTRILETDKNGAKRCATDLLYTYLCSTGLLCRTKALDEFVELTRLEDTWEWKKTGDEGLKAHDMAILFNELGIDKYIKSMFLKLKRRSNSFDFDSNEKSIILNKKAEYIAALKKYGAKLSFLKMNLKINMLWFLQIMNIEMN